MFEEQQQRLVEEIMGTLSQSTVSNQSKSLLKPKSIPLPFTPGASVQDRAPSPMIPALASQIRPTSTLPNGYKFPAKALDSEMHVKYCKLSALAKGFLVRRLLKTAKVQAIIESMKDTMNMALELHREARAGNRSVTAQDLDLHRRLLQQLNKDYHNLYDVFFNLSTSDKLGIISSDRAMRNSQKRRSKADQRRVSAVTQAKLERKRQLRELASQNGITQTKRGGSKSSSRSRSVEGPLRSKGWASPNTESRVGPDTCHYSGDHKYNPMDTNT
ncbi:hypothetical protein TCAL_16556 [Tigriopus californicus]|uniref:Uncharacterized protein n=1 Tax=Tigriopus californicus TaxID=6832 RepID=A0A553NBJ9_TIGCA|nr:hypothetical protein TCAL_16556 [Tigriopus californicus]